MNLPSWSQSRFVCRSCRAAQRSSWRPAALFTTTAAVRNRRSWSPNASITLHSSTPAKRLQRYATQTIASRLKRPLSPDKKSETTVRKSEIAPVTDFSDPASVLNQWIADSQRICSAPTIPDELDLLDLLETGRKLSEVLIYGAIDQSGSESEDGKSSTDTATSSILGLDESVRETAKAPLRMSISFRQRASAALAEKLCDLVADPKIFISQPILHVYVRIQVLLAHPEYLPEIFHLYAHKPIPTTSPPSSSSSPSSTPTITYLPPSPNNPKNHIPPPLSHAALTSAIVLKSLPLALSIIDTTVATLSFRRAKLLRRALLPLTFLSLTPFCAYTIAHQLGHHYQTSYDPNLATWLSLAAIMTYIGTTATMAFVALTTSNDQMQRVVWQPGSRLRDRWLREEERAAFDRIAVAWGFKERWRRGEERGEDWEALREFCARRGMVLDKSDLLEGME